MNECNKKNSTNKFSCDTTASAAESLTVAAAAAAAHKRLNNERH